MYALLQKFLFSLDAEAAHEFTINWFKKSQHNLLSLSYQQHIKPQPVELLGLTFKNKLGLAAGLDKNGECIDAFDAMGFGFVEVGTVTPRPQLGNHKPRLFRLPEVEGIINRMGFNNKGVDYLVEQVKMSRYKGVLGINIGKNKDTPEENAIDDYLICLNKVYEHASYVTVNISSPNTPGLRNLQYGEALDALLSGLKAQQADLAQKHGKYVPMLIKIAPDLSDEEVESIAKSLVNAKIDGVIATNTTIERSMIAGIPNADEMGGLSGVPVRAKSQALTKTLSHHLDGALPIIGVGGISNGQDAKARIEAGADLLQLYSSLIYQGPRVIKDVLSHL
ncbi:quinone-dependent dihydroorotate dehydrogenase [Alteromonadaceae bacterium M269]|nr:quinone-dependent dihydroorotate dehydrogenase [Alteromonadaceae bacterium M269]